MGDVGRAELATRRILAVGAALTALLVTTVVALLMVRDGDRSLPLWYFAIAAFAVVSFVLTGMLAPWLPARALRIGSAVAVCGYLLLLAAFLPAAAWSPELVRIPWMLSAVGAGVTAAMLAWGRRFAWFVLCVALVAASCYRLLVGGLDLDGITNDISAAVTGTVICVIAGHLLRVSRSLDLAAAASREASERASAERGRLAARTKAAALVHDEVLATLALAASELPVPRDRLAAQARGAATLVASLANDQAAAESLRSALGDEAARLGASFATYGPAEPRVDADAHEAFVLATRQALENSVRHAGAGATRAVTMTVERGAVIVDVVDNGIGFDPASVPDDRLGVRVSIRARMADLPGGAAEVLTRPGEGTWVRLSVAASVDADSTPVPDTMRDRRLLRFGLRVIGAVYALGFGVAALASSFTTEQWWAQPLALVALLVAAEVLRRSPTEKPSLVRTLVFLGLTLGSVAALLPVVPFDFAHTWFVSAAAFLLIALAARARVVPALIGLVVLIAVVLVEAQLIGATDELGYMLARPIVLVSFFVALVVAIDRMQRRTAMLGRRATRSATKSAWDAAARGELIERAAELDRRVMPMLRRIASAEPLQDADRRTAVTLGGALRDEYRAGQLARDPLIEAVRLARGRGVDVVLLDDREDQLDDSILHDIAAWMATGLEPARVMAVGRLVPGDRGALATMTVDGATTRFGG